MFFEKIDKGRVENGSNLILRTLEPNVVETAPKNEKSCFINLSQKFILQLSQGHSNPVFKIVAPYWTTYPFLQQLMR